MASKSQIINAALRALGAGPINLNDNTYDAQLMRDVYDLTVEQVMIDGDWACLRRRATLIKSVDVPEFEYSSAYILPNNLVNVLYFNNQYTGSNRQRYVVEGDKLLTNESQAQIIYTTNALVEEKWDKHLTQTVKAALKVEIARNKSAEESVVTRLLQEYSVLLTNNATRNNKQEGSKEFRSPDLIEDR